MGAEMEECAVRLTLAGATLDGGLCIPPGARGVVLFAHGSGSSRLSPRNQFVARELRNAGMATLLFDLLTREEERIDAFSAELRFDIRFLAQRLIAATDWLSARPDARALNIGYFGASTGAGAALVAAAERPDVLKAIVSRGGRPDLAADALPKVKAPTLLIVGGNDTRVIHLNDAAMRRLHSETKLAIVPGATHLFEEPGTLEQVAQLAANWFQKYLTVTS
jgi:putative phosphoribosyl transferase